MKVAIVAHYLGPKLGIGQYIDRIINPLVQELQRRSLDVLVLASPNAFKKTSSLQNLHCLVEILKPLDASPAKRYSWFFLSFRQYCRQKNITQVIWLSNPIVLPWHPSSVAVLHDFNEWKSEGKYGGRLKTLLRSLIYLDTSLFCAQNIILISKAAAQDLKKFRPQLDLSSKMHVIPNATESQLRSLAPVPIPYPDHPFLLSVGRIDPSAKRLPEAVQLVESMRKLGIPWELHMVGGMNRSTADSGKAFLADIEPLEWVKYHGHVDDASLAEWYRHTSAVVFLSDNEGFGFPIAEAASFNRWAIVSEKNKACFEAGGNALIVVNADSPKESALKVLASLQKGPPPEIVTQKWEDVARSYVQTLK